jgi:hypothetical protein
MTPSNAGSENERGKRFIIRAHTLLRAAANRINQTKNKLSSVKKPPSHGPQPPSITTLSIDFMV